MDVGGSRLGGFLALKVFFYWVMSYVETAAQQARHERINKWTTFTFKSSKLYIVKDIHHLLISHFFFVPEQSI